MKLRNVLFSCRIYFFNIYNYCNALGVDSGDTIRVPEAGSSGGRESQSGNLIIKLKAKTHLYFPSAYFSNVCPCKCTCT